MNIWIYVLIAYLSYHTHGFTQKGTMPCARAVASSTILLTRALGFALTGTDLLKYTSYFLPKDYIATTSVT